MQTLRHRLAALKAEKDKRLAENKLSLVVPTEGQEKFIRAGMPIRLLMGSNKCGKTFAGTIETISYALGCRPYLEKNDPNYWTAFKPPVKIRVIGEDFTNHIGHVLVPKLKEFLPKNQFTFSRGNPKRNMAKVEAFWEFDNKSTIEFMSSEQDVGKFESWDGHLFWFDEPPNYDVFIACMRGAVVYGGHAIITATVIKNYWLKREIWDKWRHGHPDYFAINLEIRDNLKHERIWKGKTVQTGGLTELNINKFEQVLEGNEAEKEVRTKGGFLFLSGLVLEKCNPDIHFLRKDQEPNLANCTFYEAIDPHAKKPFAITFLAVSPENIKYVYDELYIKDTITNICQAIMAKRKGKPRFTVLDPMAYILDPDTNKCWADKFEQCGIRVTKSFRSEDAKSQGVIRINEAFMENKLFFFENVYHHKEEAQNWVWDNPRGKAADRREAVHPIKKNDDFMENLYRLFVHDTRYKSYSENKFYDTKFFKKRGAEKILGGGIQKSSSRFSNGLGHFFPG